jgi:hypothetical protein
MLTPLVVLLGALVIMAIAAAVNRNRNRRPDCWRTSGRDEGASSWTWYGGGGSDCDNSDAGGCDGGGDGGGD